MILFSTGSIIKSGVADIVAVEEGFHSYFTGSDPEGKCFPTFFGKLTQMNDNKNPAQLYANYGYQKGTFLDQL